MLLVTYRCAASVCSSKGSAARLTYTETSGGTTVAPPCEFSISKRVGHSPYLPDALDYWCNNILELVMKLSHSAHKFFGIPWNLTKRVCVVFGCVRLSWISGFIRVSLVLVLVFPLFVSMAPSTKQQHLSVDDC